MNFLSNLFGKNESGNPADIGNLKDPHHALCQIDIIEPRKQDSMFPTYVMVKLLPEGLGISYDSKSAAGLDQFTEGAVIGEYHWLNSENNTEPFILSYQDIDKIACHFSKTKDNMTSFEGQTNEILKELPKGLDLKIVFIYHNKAKNTKLWVRIELMGTNQKADNKSIRKMYNVMIAAKLSLLAV